jgi:hypothetical protein
VFDINFDKFMKVPTEKVDYSKYLEFYLYLEEKEMFVKGQYADLADKKREL